MQILDLNFISLYFNDFDEAVAFYSKVFGQPEYNENNGKILGWRTGQTWLTLFPSSDGPAPGSNPRNTEFAIQVDSLEAVDELYRSLLEAGSKPVMPPRDDTMYVPMRFACVDDPFGVRLDVYCPR